MLKTDCDANMNYNGQSIHSAIYLVSQSVRQSVSQLVCSVKNKIINLAKYIFFVIKIRLSA